MSSEKDLEIISIDTSVIEAQNRAEIDMQIATAKQYPRNILRSKENAIVVATIDEETARSCGYAVPRGGKSISGPSVHLAKIIVQQWGNLRIDTKVISSDNTHVTSQSICHDLESNVAVRVEVKRSIVGKGNKRFSDDMITVTGNAANSIAFRNAVFSVIPKGVVDAVYKAAQQRMVGDVSDETKFLKKRSSIFDAFKNKYGVSEDKVLKAIGLVSLGQVTIEKLVELLAIGQALKDGDTTIEEAFPDSPVEYAEKNSSEFKEKLEKKQQKESPAEPLFKTDSTFPKQ